jgi:hypothetical protein
MEGPEGSLLGGTLSRSRRRIGQLVVGQGIVSINKSDIGRKLAEYSPDVRVPDTASRTLIISEGQDRYPCVIWSDAVAVLNESIPPIDCSRLRHFVIVASSAELRNERGPADGDSEEAGDNR